MPAELCQRLDYQTYKKGAERGREKACGMLALLFLELGVSSKANV
jgi:hypothetical protein